MTSTSLSAHRLGSGRRALRALAVAACVPYVSLKIAWVAGSEIGIPAGSVLLEHRGLMAAANSVTILMDVAVVVLALLLTQPWGLRVKTWLLVLPMWVATGLLAPIMVGFPLQLIASLFTGGGEKAAGSEPFLEDWVFGVVYTGFILQGLTLGTLFALYARERWGHVWRGTIWELPAGFPGRGVRVAAGVASVLALVPFALRLMWATGSERGLSPDRVAEHPAGFSVLEAAQAAFLVVAVAGVLALVFRLRPSLEVRTALAAAWIGSGGVGCWGGWMVLAALMPQTDPGKEPTALMVTAYAGEMITGLLLAGCVAVFLRRRAA